MIEREMLKNEKEENELKAKVGKENLENDGEKENNNNKNSNSDIMNCHNYDNTNSSNTGNNNNRSGVLDKSMESNIKSQYMSTKEGAEEEEVEKAEERKKKKNRRNTIVDGGPVSVLCDQYLSKTTARGEKDESVSSCDNKIPLNLNRYILLVAYVIYAFLTACVYFGWSSMCVILLKKNAFDWLCEGNKNGNSTDTSMIKCDEQDASIQQLFTMTLAIHSLFSVIGGILLDSIGPKFTAILGQTSNIIGWLLLSFCSSSFRAYHVSFVFIGIGADTSFLPIISVCNLFPQNLNLITAVLGAAASASFAIPTILNSIHNRYANQISINQLCLSYMVAGPILCLFLAAVLSPPKPFFLPPAVEQSQIHNDNNNRNKSNKNNNVSVSDDNSNNNCYFNDNINDHSVIQVYSTHHNNDDSSFTHLTDNNNTNNNTNINTNINTNTTTNNNYSNINVADDAKQNNINDDNNDNKGEIDQSKKSKKLSMLTSSLFMSEFLTTNYILICVIYFIIVNIAISYYQQASQRMFSSSVIDVLDILLPLSFVPCIILGKLIDVYNVIIIMFIVNLFGFFSFLFAFIDVTFLHYASVTCFSVYVSLFTSQIFCFVMLMFSPKNFGKLSGLSIMIGGLCSLLSYPLYDHLTLRYLNNNTTPVCISLSICLFLTFFLIAYVYYMHRKSKIRLQIHHHHSQITNDKYTNHPSNNFDYNINKI